MNKEAVARRIDLVGSSTGSVVSVATWCALHAQDAEVIIPYISERMQSNSTADHSRASLLYVLHEVLLTCASRGVSETGKLAILRAVSRSLPSAVEAVFRRPSVEYSDFLVALDKVLGWWEMLRLFPGTWIDSLRRCQRAAAGSQTESSMLAALQEITHMVSRYHDAKAQWKENSGDADAADAARRALTSVRKAVDSRMGSSNTLIGWCDAQHAELDGSATTVKQSNDEPSLRAVKTEATADVSAAAPLPAMAEEDDILGSFY